MWPPQSLPHSLSSTLLVPWDTNQPCSWLFCLRIKPAMQWEILNSCPQKLSWHTKLCLRLWGSVKLEALPPSRLSPPPAAAPSPTWSPEHQIPTPPLRLFSAVVWSKSVLCVIFPITLPWMNAPRCVASLHSRWYCLILPVLVLQSKWGSCSSPDLYRKTFPPYLVCTCPHSELISLLLCSWNPSRLLV